MWRVVVCPVASPNYLENNKLKKQQKQLLKTESQKYIFQSLGDITLTILVQVTKM